MSKITIDLTRGLMKRPGSRITEIERSLFSSWICVGTFMEAKRCEKLLEQLGWDDDRDQALCQVVAACFPGSVEFRGLASYVCGWCGKATRTTKWHPECTKEYELRSL